MPILKPPTVQCVRIAELRKIGYDSLEDWENNKKHIYTGGVTRFVKGSCKSKWASPFRVHEDNTIDQVLKDYRKHIRTSGLYDQLGELSGKVLGCWCYDGKCHADVLVQLFKQKFNLNAGK